MASCSDSVTTDSQKTNSLSNRSDSQLDAEVTDTEIKGYLMKRARLSRKWKKQWFLLKNCDLYYSESPKGSLKKIPLTDADISETRVDKKQYAFQIRSKQNGRTYYIHAENEMTQNNWMQAICFAKAAGNNGGASQACVVQ
ncbi:PH domain-containing protein [Biomphalaria glabrata]|uniref:PH domain-containing protein DDB_G0274775-like n=1 Tax=Biomphalaria glabrata TaxID=6526 RepID=A0A2C9JX39_BIOGL|nr:PH domain-containing protein DDB_G0274775-like [Biomphalaria glabrata]KAI8735182.1 PH domain-containing protein [Biomphalaria glabrata]KAI8784449.1 PH domain-containing protein [Biomphalaria glabrata]